MFLLTLKFKDQMATRSAKFMLELELLGQLEQAPDQK